MIKNKKLTVIMPAYNAVATLEMTYRELPFDVVDEVILVDDASTDTTTEIARKLGIQHVIVHDNNKGYGANQKTCYEKALSLGSDIVVMVHPDYQYTPALVRAMASLIADEVFDCVLGSRILGTGALKGKMPLYKYAGNRILTLFQNLVVGTKLSEYHTGYRAYSAELLATLPFDKNADGFIFDNQILLQIVARGYLIGEVSCPTRYFAEASSISGWPLLAYGFGVITESIKYRLTQLKLVRSIYSQ